MYATFTTLAGSGTVGYFYLDGPVRLQCSTALKVLP